MQEDYCPYTGAKLRQVPYRAVCGELRIWFVRESDGCNMHTRRMSDDEKAWADNNPGQTLLAITAGKAWHIEAQSKAK